MQEVQQHPTLTVTLTRFYLLRPDIALEWQAWQACQMNEGVYWQERPRLLRLARAAAARSAIPFFIPSF